MRKWFYVLMSFLISCTLISCAQNKSYEITIRIPAGSTEKFVYSDEEICPSKGKITITSVEGVSDTEILLLPVQSQLDLAYKPEYLTMGYPVNLTVEKGGWYKIGINQQNISDEELIVKLKVDHIIEVRIEEKETKLVQLSVVYHEGKLSFVVENNTDERLYIYDASFLLEINKCGEWVRIPFQNVGFCGNPSSVDPYDKYGPFVFEHWYEPLEDGEYRLSLIVTDEYMTFNKGDTPRITTEFVK